MSRRIDKLPPHVYFVIGEHTRYDGEDYTTVDGPYSTLSAAKGMRTSICGANHIYDVTKREEALKKYSILKSPAGEWEKVEL